MAMAMGIAGAVGARAEEPTPTPWVPPCELAPMPDAAPPGMAVSIVGTCYRLHSGRSGGIYFDDRLVAHVSGDTPGHYSAGFVVPADARIGAHQIAIRADGNVAARVVFDVLPFCRGDCDADGRVTVAEVLRGVNAVLGLDDAAPCPVLDRDHDGSVAIDDVIAAIADALSGCLIEFTPTPTPRDTPTPVPRGGACRDTGECLQPDLLCIDPSGFAGCLECHYAGDEACGSDGECASRSPGTVCELRPMLGPDCLCASASICVPGCASGDDCGLGLRCTAGHCAEVPCTSDDDCVPQLHCFEYNGARTCVRRYCTDDSGCPEGVCVNNRCDVGLGTCLPFPGLPGGDTD